MFQRRNVMNHITSHIKLFRMYVSIYVGCLCKIVLAPFCTALHMDYFSLFLSEVVHKACTTSALPPRCALNKARHVSMKHLLLLNTSIAKLSICIWTTIRLFLHSNCHYYFELHHRTIQYLFNSISQSHYVL